MTEKNVILQVPARKAGAGLPGRLAVGDAAIELTSERTTNGGSHARRYAARWTKGSSQGTAYVDIRPASKTSTDIRVTLERPKGPQAFLWPKASLNRLAALFASAIAYEVETRSIEEADPFAARRTTPELVKARSA